MEGQAAPGNTPQRRELERLEHRLGELRETVGGLEVEFDAVLANVFGHEPPREITTTSPQGPTPVVPDIQPATLDALHKSIDDTMLVLERMLQQSHRLRQL